MMDGKPAVIQGGFTSTLKEIKGYVPDAGLPVVEAKSCQHMV